MQPSGTLIHARWTLGVITLPLSHPHSYKEDCGKRQSWAVNQVNHFPDLSQFTDPEPLNEGTSGSPEEVLDKIPQSLTVNLSPVLSPEGPTAFHKGNCTLGKRKKSDFSGSVGYWFSINCDSGKSQETVWPSS